MYDTELCKLFKKAVREGDKEAYDKYKRHLLKYCGYSEKQVREMEGCPVCTTGCPSFEITGNYCTSYEI